MEISEEGFRSKYIKTIGVELEGGIDSKGYDDCETHFKKDLLDEKFIMGTDGSAFVSGVDHSGLEWRYWDFNNNNFDDLFDMLRFCYSKGFKTSSKCGFHIHMRFRDMDKYIVYSAYPSFQKKFIMRYLKTFGDKIKYVKRLDDPYCIAEWSPKLLDLQLKEYGNARRSAINLGAYAKHRTLEIRLFPNQDSYEEAINSVKWVITNVDEILDEVMNEEQTMFKFNINNLATFVKERDISDESELLVVKINFDKTKANFRKKIILKPVPTKIVKDMSAFIYKSIEDHICELVKKQTGEDPREW